MITNLDRKELAWARSLQALALTGLSYTQNTFEIDRYNSILEIAAEMLAEYTGNDKQEVMAQCALEEGYITPKVDVRGVVFKDNKLLLVKELADGCWTLPGGWADINMTPAQNTEREVWEESGYTVKATRLLAVLDRRLHGHPPTSKHIFKLFFWCDLIGGEAKTSNETDGAEFFAENDMPSLSLTRVTPAQIHMLFEHMRNPSRPVDFD